ncbi:hypothetical protein DPV78_002724 [Talaromyces pinophilus]|nr:hypothetical protein DPV78_002724 [Talaromyces pinophilus]
MNSESTNLDAINTSTHTNADFADSNNNNMNNTNDYNIQNKTDAVNYAADNKRDNLAQGLSQSAETPSTNTDSFERDSAPRESESRGFEDRESRNRDFESRESENRDAESRDTGNRDTSNRDSNASKTDKDGVPKKGIAGVIKSNFGADKTTTSTFEKSQGEKYGEGFDETGAQLKGRFSVDESAAASGSATGGGEYAMGGKQGGKAGKDTNVPSAHGSHNGAQKESFGHRILGKAEGLMHRHHHDKTDSRTDVQ